MALQILHEPAIEWPESGPLRVNAQYVLTGEIDISPDDARRAANGYLVSNVGFFLKAEDPCLVWRDHPSWRFSIYLHLRGFGQVARLGEIEVDSTTRRIVPLADESVKQIQARADEICTQRLWHLPCAAACGAR